LERSGQKRRTIADPYLEAIPHYYPKKVLFAYLLLVCWKSTFGDLE
jgi:hypothetical protein